MIDQNTLKSIEDLYRLKTDGIITEDEFERSKQKLLFGGKSPTPAVERDGDMGGPLGRLLGPPPPGLPAKDDGIGWITLPLKRYATFTGRSTRKEFWMFQLLSVALIFIGYLALTEGVDRYGEGTAMAKAVVALVILALLGLFVPLLAVEARRFRDMNQSPWLVLLNVVPYIGTFVVLIAMLVPGTVGDNKYGPDPLAE